MRALSACCCVAALVAATSLVAPAQDAVARLSVTLHPQAADASGLIHAVDVRVCGEGFADGVHALQLAMPSVESNVQTVAESIHSLQARDDDGVILFSRQDRSAGRGMVMWSAARAPHGQLCWSYSAPITNAPNPLGAAPPLELRSEGSAFSGQASTFLFLPVSDRKFVFDLRWNLLDLPQGSVGISTLGLGDVAMTHSITGDEIGNLYFAAGALHLFPEQPTAQGFISAIEGQPPFDGRTLMQWTEQLYRYYFSFFKPAAVGPYVVLLRRNPINAGGGVELGNAFIGTFDKQADTTEFKMTLAHEMVHTFVRGLEGDEFAGSWFSEGIAVYYERLLPLRAASITYDDYLRDVNATAARYYTNALMHTPNSGIGAQFWSETRVRVLPYDRGSLYFAKLDHELRMHSNGKRSLDDLVAAMLDLRRQGRPVTEQAWRTLLKQKLGSQAVAEFEAMLQGEEVLPASDAFGPCAARSTAKLRRYDLGFEAAVLTEPTRIVRGLRTDSNAAMAGLRNGDHILHPVPQDGIQGDQHALLHLEVERNGRQMQIEYLPRGEEVDAYQWMLVSGADKNQCAPAATR